VTTQTSAFVEYSFRHRAEIRPLRHAEVGTRRAEVGTRREFEAPQIGHDWRTLVPPPLRRRTADGDRPREADGERRREADDERLRTADGATLAAALDCGRPTARALEAEVQMLRAQLEAQIRLAAENETDSGPPARRGVSKKHLAGLHLGERL